VSLKRLFALLCLVLLGGSRDPILVPEVSQHEVEVRQGFTGTELLLYGAILDPQGIRAGRDYDIVVVLKGPSQSITVREKEKRAGIWVNAHTAQFRSAPAFYAVASSRPVEQIVDARTAAIYELGLPFIQLSPIGTIEPDKQARFAAGLAGVMAGDRLYQEDPRGVTVREQVLYQARITLPSNVQTGAYTAETFAISKGRVVASAIARVDVQKRGFERLVADSARHHGILYGLVAVAFSIFMGWVAGRVFAYV
jgi:uncharacterized protein (TIGR02186 family)